LFLAIKAPITTAKMMTRMTITTTSGTTIPTTDVRASIGGGTPVEYVSPVSFQLQVND